ncbi:N-methyl-L-tryptophan oxidase [Amycolatopsis rhabdoformis]|uniref:N-methyl-L-tryptophan oxidase n=1 Tax=Amycolatopsis rhabdoformis TaxID=1448059 RepID=A0ABZ1IJT6_9PSEU|nr:N-methyl-L-tryptophan oxidase [Amycolatopsis rhabdoformis]WSE34522.1 N-methyl-L-tryptophan oxidase [Amycolatopsis rhabdoformis]
MTITRTEVVVIGVGTMGSAILWRLAERGVRVLGLERFAPGHDRGSGHGESRILRTAQHEDPAYVPLVKAAVRGWRELERQTRTSLLTMTGGLSVGPSDGMLIRGALEAAAVHGLECGIVPETEAAQRFPAHRMQPGDTAVWERDAGVVRPEQAIVAAARRAVELGAGLRTGVRVLGVEDGPGDTVLVRLADGLVQADHVVLAAGPWISQLVPRAALPLTVERKILAWFPAAEPRRFEPDRFPVFLRETPEGRWYGFPTLDHTTVKVAFHHGGLEVDPDEIDRTVTAADVAPLGDVVARHLRGLDPVAVRAATCMYTNTPDAHFALGTPAAYRHLTVVSACSGHGFKFAPAIGELAADLALGSAPELPLDLFALDRFAGSVVGNDRGDG